MTGLADSNPSSDPSELAHIKRLVYDLVARGLLVVTGEDADGNPTFALTEEGERHVEEMLP